MGNRGSAVVETRVVEIGNPDENLYPDNRVVSYKYTAWNFLPKNLFEQLRRAANFYFLCMGIICACLTDPPESAWSTLAPLILVVSITAAKQGYEDFLRHRADNKINNSLVTVVRNGVLQEIRCKKVCVGDIVKVTRDGEIPCDMVLLISSHSDNKCSVMTANLDGETNLKTVDCPADCELRIDHLPRLSGKVSCEPPTVDLYHFYGNITLSLRPSTAAADDVFNSTFNKDSCELGTLSRGSVRSRGRGQNYGRQLSKEEREISAPLSYSNLLLRGSRLRNTEFVFGCAVYTGQETKLALNSVLTSNKFSIVEKTINLFLLFFFTVMMSEVVLSVVLTFIYQTNKESWWYLGDYSGLTFNDFITYIFTYIVLYYYVIPISLYVTIEFERFCGTFFFEWDKDLTIDGQPAICNTSDLNEELGQVQYLFSDKTGTLTENDMKFRRCSIEGSLFYEKRGQLLQLSPTGDTISGIPLTEPWPPEVEQFLVSMALCHTVQTLREVSDEGDQLTPDPDQTPEYQATSPDEKALVEAAARCGVVFLGSEGGYMSVSVRGEVRRFKKLQTLEFTSDRKRMSVVVSDSAGHIWLLCKGADSTMMPLMVSGHREETMRHLNDFSMRGLRTLVMGVRQLEMEDYGRVSADLREARGVLDPVEREAGLTRALGALEQGLRLQGVTAVEDRLQERVQETLNMLQTAGIKVWVLTGDKVETALNIAYSCGHFKMGTRRMDLIETSSEIECTATLQNIKHTMEREELAQYGLVVDGASLKLALQHDQALFREVALSCSTVLCCRLSPKQKAELVSLVKRSEGRPIVAAVGDGANDVSMIQEADVGIGIIGKEGRQAVRCSDFALAKFQCLSKAFLVHGHWYYLRAAVLVQYFFYKNIVFNTPQLYFSLLSEQNTQSLYMTAFLTLYNTIFSASPIMLYSLFEQDYSAATLLARPELYKLHRHNRLMSRVHFIEWLSLGVWHSLVVYFVPVLFLDVNSIFFYDDSPIDFSAMSITILHNVVVVVNIKLMIHSTHWTLLFVLAVVLTILTFMVFCLFYNMIFITDTSQSIFYVYYYLLASPNFWFVNFLCVVFALLPDFVLRTFQNQKFRRPQLPSWLPTRRKGVFVIPRFRSSKVSSYL